MLILPYVPLAEYQKHTDLKMGWSSKTILLQLLCLTIEETEAQSEQSLAMGHSEDLG